MSREKANMAQRYEHEIPEGCEARIEGNKVIIEKKKDVDEKTRKSIVDFIWRIANGAFNRGSMPSAVQCQEWLSYLEKQKDERELGFIEGKVEGARQTCQEIKDAMSLFEPKDLTPFESTFRDYIDSAIRYCLSGEGYQQYIKEWAADLLNLERREEQKPAEWSEEDKKALNRAINICRNDFGEYSETAKFLKSLPKRFNLQPQQQWSEEDERIKDNLLSELFNLYVGAQIKESTYFKYKDWVKTIPRPISLTKEQKCAIRRATVIAENNGEDHLARVLNSVYNETNLAS